MFNQLRNTHDCRENYISGETRNYLLGRFGEDSVKPQYKRFAISTCKAKLSKISFVWTGKQIKPSVAWGYSDIERNVDYTVSYRGKVNIGKGTIIVSGKGRLKGAISVNFKIVPTKNSISKITAGKKKMKVKWKKVSATQKVTKYQVRYRVKGASKWKTKTFAATKSSATIKKLKKGKKYQIQTRSYKTVSGTNYYSAWSAVKNSKKIK